MKRFLSVACLVFLLCAGGAQAHAAGQFCDSANICNYATQAAADAASAAYAANNEAPKGFAPAPVASPSQAAYKKPTSPTQPTSNQQYDGIMTAIMGLFAWLLGVAMLTLDASVYYTVIHMGNLLSNNNGGLAAVGVAWRILRDIGNIVLIFGFLALGIETILGINFYGGGMKMLPILLLSAVLLNFSLFISEAVIDVGNLFATEFFVQINDGQVPQPASFTLTSVHNEGVSDKIMSQLGLQTLYGNALDPTNKDIFKGGNVLLIGFMGIILFLVAAFVMFTLAFILIARFVALIFIIVVAPIGIAGLAVPKLESQARKWWGVLFEQTITAPVLLLMLYVALAVITDSQFLTGFGVSNSKQGAWTGFVNNGDLPGFAGLMLSFIVAMGLLLAVTVIAKKMSAAGAGAATKWGSRLSGVGLAMAVPGAVGRNTIGRASHSGAAYVRRTSFGRSAAGRLVAGGLDRGAKATYDPRNTSGVKAGAGALLKGTGLNLGTGTKANFADTEKKAIEGREKYSKSLQMTKPEKEQLDAIKQQKESLEKQQENLDMHKEAWDANRDFKLNQLDTKHRTEQAVAQGEVEQQRARARLVGAVARASGTDADKQAAIGAEAALRDSEQKLRDLREQQADARQQIEKEHATEIASIHASSKSTGAAIKAAENSMKTMGQIPQRAYVANLEKATLAEGLMYGPGRSKAIDKIKKDLNKKDGDKSLEIIQSFLEKQNSGGDEEKKNATAA